MFSFCDDSSLAARRRLEVALGTALSLFSPSTLSTSQSILLSSASSFEGDELRSERRRDDRRERALPGSGRPPSLSPDAGRDTEPRFGYRELRLVESDPGDKMELSDDERRVCMAARILQPAATARARVCQSSSRRLFASFPLSRQKKLINRFWDRASGRQQAAQGWQAGRVQPTVAGAGWRGGWRFASCGALQRCQSHDSVISDIVSDAYTPPAGK